MKLAMLRVDQAVRCAPELQARLLLQVHDEVVLEVPARSSEVLAGLVRTAMQEAYALIVPLVVDVKSGPNWRDVSPWVEDIVPLVEPVESEEFAG